MDTQVQAKCFSFRNCASCNCRTRCNSSLNLYKIFWHLIFLFAAELFCENNTFSFSVLVCVSIAINCSNVNRKKHSISDFDCAVYGWLWIAELHLVINYVRHTIVYYHTKCYVKHADRSIDKSLSWFWWIQHQVIVWNEYKHNRFNVNANKVHQWL